MVCNILLGNALRILAQERLAADSYQDAIHDFDKLVSSLYRGQYHSENLAIAMVNLSQLQTDPKQATERIRTLAAAQNEFVQLITLHGELPRLVRSLASTTLTLADAQRAAGNHEAALLSYAQADTVFQNVLESSDPGNDAIGQAFLCRLHWAEVAWQMGRPQEAEQLLEKTHQQAAAWRPGSSTVAAAQSHVMLADIRWQAGTHESAQILYATALKLLEQDQSTAGRLAHVSLRLNCHDDRFRSIDDAIEICNQTPDGQYAADFLHFRALALFRQGDWSASREVLEQAMSLRDRRHAADVSLLALIERQAGNTDSAESHNKESKSLFDTTSWYSIRLQDEYRRSAPKSASH